MNKSNVITYQLKDMNDEIIEGKFYEKELQLTKNTIGEYIIENVLVGHEVKHPNKKGLKSSFIYIARASNKIFIRYNMKV